MFVLSRLEYELEYCALQCSKKPVPMHASLFIVPLAMHAHTGAWNRQHLPFTTWRPCSKPVSNSTYSLIGRCMHPQPQTTDSIFFRHSLMLQRACFQAKCRRVAYKGVQQVDVLCDNEQNCMIPTER